MPNTGQILFHSGTSLRSKTIQFGTECEWSHCGIIVKVLGSDFVLELQKRKSFQMPRVGLTPLSYYTGRKHIIIDYPKPINVKPMLPYCGVLPYDIFSLGIFQVIRQAAKKVFNKDIWRGRTGAKAFKRVTCSEFIAYFIDRQAGDFPEWYKASPADIYFKIFQLLKESNLV